MSNETERIVWYDVSKHYCSRFAQTATDFADASHSKSAKSAATAVSYGIFSSENAYPCTVTCFLASGSCTCLDRIGDLKQIDSSIRPVCLEGTNLAAGEGNAKPVVGAGFDYPV